MSLHLCIPIRLPSGGRVYVRRSTEKSMSDAGGSGDLAATKRNTPGAGGAIACIGLSKIPIWFVL
jgi:hypothetical protein